MNSPKPCSFNAEQVDFTVWALFLKNPERFDGNSVEDVKDWLLLTMKEIEKAALFMKNKKETRS